MRIGVIPNINKEKIIEIVNEFSLKCLNKGIDIILSGSLSEFQEQLKGDVKQCPKADHGELGRLSDIVVSIGGDGTMLNTAYDIRTSNTPMLGLNFGKLGFLAEFDLNFIDELIEDIRTGNYEIGERIALQGECPHFDNDLLYAVNDLVIDKGRWPKMIKLTLKVDDDYVSTFSADGIIIATPTGSTGYSMSVGGPIVSPAADAIVVSPISPHTLTMRPIVLSSSQKITVIVYSEFESVQINSDGQRVHYYEPPFTVEVKKSPVPVKLIHTARTNYFEILRNKLLWGLDVRNNYKIKGNK